MYVRQYVAYSTTHEINASMRWDIASCPKCSISIDALTSTAGAHRRYNNQRVTKLQQYLGTSLVILVKRLRCYTTKELPWKDTQEFPRKVQRLED
jgi:hypothetical protein